MTIILKDQDQYSLNTNLTMKCCQLRGDGEPRHQGGDRAGRAGEGHEAKAGGRGAALFNIIIIHFLHYHFLHYQHLQVFVFVSLSPADPAPAALSAAAVLEVAEREGRTFVVPRARVETLGYQYTYPCRCASAYLRISTHIYTPSPAGGSASRYTPAWTLSVGRSRSICSS